MTIHKFYLKSKCVLLYLNYLLAQLHSDLRLLLSCILADFMVHQLRLDHYAN